jgi:ketosteroid isomerase-like protein
VSRENVEIIKAGFDAWNAGDMDRLRDMYDPNVVLYGLRDWPEPGPYAGREAVMRQWAQLRDTWDADVLEPTGDFIDVGDRVVVRQKWRGFGRGPDATIEMTSIFTFRESRITSLEYFWEHAEALKAVGLEA